MKHIYLLSLLALLCACGKSEKDERQNTKNPNHARLTQNKVQLKWDQPPKAHVKASAELIFPATGQPVEVLDVNPQMPAHGHGTIKEYQKVAHLGDDPVRIRLSGLYFIMAGAWVIDIKVKVGDKTNTLSFPAEVQ